MFGQTQQSEDGGQLVNGRSDVGLPAGGAAEAPCVLQVAQTRPAEGVAAEGQDDWLSRPSGVQLRAHDARHLLLHPGCGVNGRDEFSFDFYYGEKAEAESLLT